MVCLPMGRDQDGNAARAALADPGLAGSARRQAAIIRADIAADRGVAELEALAMR